ncbi:hypothetical protein JT06_19135 [Desulfobulbus sp. Tol-SR]|jgi:hypothetical protein|nr:hypothetical protein JT06_19135 [Desulfobulbus sp. Tol-SR]
MNVWRRAVTGIVGVAVGVSAAPSAFALGNGYTPGTEGAMGATLPPPGFHYKQYNILVDTDELQDEDGDDAVIMGPGAKVDFSAKVFAQVHRFIYSPSV